MRIDIFIPLKYLFTADCIGTVNSKLFSAKKITSTELVLYKWFSYLNDS